MTASRTTKSVKNSQVALLHYVLILILGFVSRKVFIDQIGMDVLGLNTTVANLLELLNLAELGIGTAVAVTLYKPLFENDHTTINEIVALQGWLYRRIAYVVLIASVVLMCFFPLIFGKMDLPLWYAYAAFSVFLASALLTYFANYRQAVLSADQKEYKITLSYRVAMLLKRVIQIVAVIYCTNGYIWWLGLELVFAIVASYVLNRTIRKEYPYLHSVANTGQLVKKYPDVVTKIKQIFIHKIGAVVLTQTSPLIIYLYASLTLVALYGNYMLIITSVMALCQALFSSMDASVGNLIAQGNRTHALRVFEELFSVRFFIAVTICVGVYWLTPLFVEIWLGSEYIMDNLTLVLMVGFMYINITRTIVDSFKSAFGLFRDVWASAVEASLNLGLSLLLGYYWGLHGILVGVLISLLAVVFVWKPYFVFKEGFKEKIGTYVKIYAKHFLAAVVAYLLIAYLSTFINIDLHSNIWRFIVSGIVYVGSYALVLFVMLYAGTQGMKDFVSRLKIVLGG